MGVMRGAGAAKTGLFWMRLGGGEAEEEEPSLAEAQGRNVALLREDWAGETELRQQLLMEAVDDIVRATQDRVWLYSLYPTVLRPKQIMKAKPQQTRASSFGDEVWTMEMRSYQSDS